MKTIQLSERELSIVYSLMAPPYRAEDIRSDEFNELRNKVFYALRDAQNDEPVTTAYKLPANTPCKDAPEHIWLQTAGVWPENGEFSELTWCSDNQHKDDTLYVRADVVTGNSPVIPDGWVVVPVEPTEEMNKAGWTAMNEHDAINPTYRAMLAAAPQQEADNE